tara:strand:+ start:406 stop:1017 length:612 start_codon:yes stop_codon:yes gene_type:complete
MSGKRKAKVTRTTTETQIWAEVNLDGSGNYKITTGIGFLDHMLEQFSRHSLIDIELEAKGDLHIDAHHTTEDSGYVIGGAIGEALGSRVGINRFAHAEIPMDESLSSVTLDVSGRPFLEWKVTMPNSRLGEMDTELFKEWFRAFAQAAGITIHVRNAYGENSHHIIESCFKALGRSLREAVEIDKRNVSAIPSTKGSIGGKEG